MSQPLLQARELRRSYSERLVVDVNELSVSSGEVLAVLGPNGSGKSTLFRLLLLLEQPDSGRVEFAGRAVTRSDREARRRMAGVFQRPFLFSGTVRANIEFAARALRLDSAERERRVNHALAALHLERNADAACHTLSGGEAQRVALARAIVNRPELLLLDEPTANLDVTAKRRFRDDLAVTVREHAGAVILITHDPADAFGLADRIAVMEQGKIVQSGTPEDLIGEPRTPFVAAFTGAELLLDGVVVESTEELVQVELAAGVRLWAVLSPHYDWRVQQGERVHVAYRPEDVLISRAASGAELSARNHFRLQVAALGGTGALLRLRLQGTPALNALITRVSAESLELRPGSDVIAHMKAAALRVLPA